MFGTKSCELVLLSKVNKKDLSLQTGHLVSPLASRLADPKTVVAISLIEELVA